MVQHKSLLHYLDKQLPGSWAIALRRFFWFMPFVRPVDEHSVKLRALVNRAKKNHEENEYLSYYLENRQHFIYKHKSIAFTFSAKEKELLPHSKEENEEDLQIDSPTKITTSLNPFLEIKQPEISTTEAPKQPNHLTQVLTLLKQANWRELFASYIGDLDNSSKLNLLHNLINKYEDHHSESLQSCILSIVDGVTTDLQQVKQIVFNDLQNAENVTDFFQFLNIKAETYRTELIALLDQLGEMRAENARCVYKVQKDYNALSSSLREMRSANPIYTYGDILETFKHQLQLWQQKHNPTTDSIVTLISEIHSCISRLLNIVNIIKTDTKLRLKVLRDEKHAIEEQQLAEERQKFSQAIRNGTLIAVSLQRIRELYPKDEDYHKKILQCQKLSITLFDAADESAKKHAIEQQRINKNTQELLSDDNFVSEPTATESLSMMALG